MYESLVRGSLLAWIQMEARTNILFPSMSWTWSAGRNFLQDETGNTIIISEGALPRLGFADASGAIGSRIEVLSNGAVANGDDWISAEIIGVIKGYRVRPLFKYVGEFDKMDRGIALTYKTKLVSTLTPEKITLQVNTQNLAATMDQVRKEYEDFVSRQYFYMAIPGWEP